VHRRCSIARLIILIAGAISGCESSIPSTPTVTPPVRVVTTLSAQPFVRAATDRSVTGPTSFVITVAASQPDLLDSVSHESVVGVTLYIPNGTSLWATPLADESIAVIVHPANAIGDLTLAQVRDAFAGRAPEWAAATREEGDDSRMAFEALALNGLKPAATTILAPSPETMLKFVSGTPNGIGFAPLRWVNETVKVVAIEGKRPGEEGYALNTLIVAVAKEEPTGAAREWLAKLQSAQP